MYIRIADLPESTVKPVMEEFQAELERKLQDASGGAQTAKAADDAASATS